MLGPGWGVGIAFCASLIRNLLGLGSLMAFPGSMIGALCCGLAYMAFRKLWLTCIAEASGTGILGGLAAYPVAKLLMGLNPGGLFVYIVPFLNCCQNTRHRKFFHCVTLFHFLLTSFSCCFYLFFPPEYNSHLL